MEIKRILVGVDFSEASRAGLEQALELARHRGASVVLARVCDLPRPPTFEDDAHGDIEAQFDELARIQRGLESDALDELDRRYRGRGVPTERVLIDGTPARGLLAAARDHDVDLIVLGDKGQTREDGGGLGSVAARVARQTDRPLLVARPGGDAVGGYDRVLVATEFSGYADELMHAAGAVSAPDVRIDVIHCWRLPLGAYSRAVVHESPAELARQLRDKVTAHASARGADLVEQYSGIGRRVTFELVEDRARRGILRQLGEAPYDVVVIGSHGMRGFRPKVIGTTAAAVIRRSRTSVLVIPIGDPRDDD